MSKQNHNNKALQIQSQSLRLPLQLLIKRRRQPKRHRHPRPLPRGLFLCHTLTPSITPPGYGAARTASHTPKSPVRLLRFSSFLRLGLLSEAFAPSPMSTARLVSFSSPCRHLRFVIYHAVTLPSICPIIFFCGILRLRGCHYAVTVAEIHIPCRNLDP